MDFEVERISRRHERRQFDCGEPSMNEYLQRFGRQNDVRELSRLFVAVRPGQAIVVGYYTLSAGSVTFGTLPPQIRRGLARYPVPVAHLGRLATDRSVRGEGLGGLLLIDALRRVARVSRDLAVFAVEVLALHETARSFYIRFGFQKLEDDPLHLYLPIESIRAII